MMDVSQFPGTPRTPWLRSEQITTLLVAAVIGVAAAIGALVFRAMILGAESVFWQTQHLTVDYLESVPWYWRLLVPAIGALLLSPIVVRWAPEARGSGIPEVIESVALRGGTVAGKIAPLKALAAALAIGSGGSAGREGPIVHIGGAIGSWIAQRFHSSVKQTRTYVGCGVAGGIAATFNTPFAGALFAVEVVLGDLGTAKISPIVIASITATVVSRHYSGDFPHIVVPAVEETTTILTLLAYVLIGIICGGISALFIRMMGWGWWLAGRWRGNPYFLPAMGGLLVGVIGIWLPHVFGVGYDTLNNALQGNLEIGLMLALVLAKLLATSATLTSGGSGGIFAPSLLIGALVGGAFGKYITGLMPGLSGSATPTLVFVLVGMGAMVAGATRAPISAILVIFELTYQPSIIVPLMAAAIPSVIISSHLHKDSIYLAKLAYKGIRIRNQSDQHLLKGLHVSDVMQSRVESVPPDMQLMELVDKFLTTPFPVMWMTDEKGKLLGILESRNLQIAMLERESLLNLVLANDVAVPAQAPVRPQDDLSLAMRLFDQTDFEILPVLDPKTNQVLGDLLRNDVIAAYNRELAMRDSLAVAVDAIGVADRLGSVELGDGYALVEYEMPSHLVGRSLAELNLRKKLGVQAILIRRGRERVLPTPDMKFQPGDVVLFAGEAEGLEQKLKGMS